MSHRLWVFWTTTFRRSCTMLKRYGSRFSIGTKDGVKLPVCRTFGCGPTGEIRFDPDAVRHRHTVLGYKKGSVLPMLCRCTLLRFPFHRHGRQSGKAAMLHLPGNFHVLGAPTLGSRNGNRRKSMFCKTAIVFRFG